MIVDCHVHVSAFIPGHGHMSQGLQGSLPFRIMRWRMWIKGNDERAEQQIAQGLAETIDQTPELDAAVVLAFDAVHDADGRFDAVRTQFYVTNDYVIDLVRGHRRMLFGASVHPYRRDAVPEIERCVKAGAVLLKWLPIVQDFNPADDRCLPVYEALAHYKLPLLSHTGGEKALPVLNMGVADPSLLEPALRRGVTVIAAHCGTRSSPGETDFVPDFVRLAAKYENCFGDTAALNLPTRSYAWDELLGNPGIRRKLVHGSDWPIPSYPPISQLHLREVYHLLRQRNMMRRDVLIKQRLGLDDSYWHRGATLLRRPPDHARSPQSHGTTTEGTENTEGTEKN
jgi:uncharacterized protein